MSTLISKNKKFVSEKASIIKPGIESICIINKRGRLTQSIGNQDLGLPRAKKEMFLMKIALRTAMQKDFDEDLDKVNYCMTQRGGKKFISIPTVDDNTVLAVTENDFDHEKFVDGLIKTLNDSDEFLGELLPKEGEL